jgi:hypothetical protein
MHIPVFSERVRIVLIHAGWTPDRAWDTHLARSAHELRGLAFHAAAENFLRAFGGLQIIGSAGLLVTTDVPDTLSRMSDRCLREYEGWVGEPLSVVGCANDGTQLLMMSPRGVLYGAKGELIVAYGTNIADVFDRLCVERLPPKRDWN